MLESVFNCPLKLYRTSEEKVAFYYMNLGWLHLLSLVLYKQNVAYKPTGSELFKGGTRVRYMACSNEMKTN